MDLQVEAMEVQLHLAADLQRSVSIHVVQAWGPVMDLFQRVKKHRLEMFYGMSSNVLKKSRKERIQERKIKNSLETRVTEQHLWPPKIYFHSFGGKSAVIDQLDALLGRSITSSSGEIIPASELFFGFAPVINFRSPKTAQVIQKVGIHRLVLETDVEEYHDVIQDLHRNVAFVAAALDIEPHLVVEKTLENSKRLYNMT
jgi:Tat protein secretion system quality control protein TatD with DNase activity